MADRTLVDGWYMSMSDGRVRRYVLWGMGRLLNRVVHRVIRSLSHHVVAHCWAGHVAGTVGRQRLLVAAVGYV